MRRPEAQPAILPRDRHGATRAVAYFMLTGAAFIIVLSTFIPGYRGPTLATAIATYTTGFAIGILGWVCWRWPARLPDGFWVAVPFIAIALIGGLDYVTADAGVGGQLFFLWPTLYAATFLSRRLILLVLACVFATDFALVYTLRGLTQAIWDTASVMTGVTLASIIIWTLRTRVAELLRVLEAQALQDTLTGLANRRAFERDIVHAIAQARRSGEPLSLLTLDVDNFKYINDSSGHAIGDQALLAVASALRIATREADMIARLGGDEFVALLVNCDAAGSAAVAESLRDALEQTWDLPREPMTLSIGAATLPLDADTQESLVAASDAALYAAKARGRNQVVCASAPERSAR